MRFQPEMTGLCLTMTLALMLPGCGGDTEGAGSVGPLAPAAASGPAVAAVAVPDAVPAAHELGLQPSVNAKFTELQSAVSAPDEEAESIGLAPDEDLEPTVPAQEAGLQAGALAQDADLQRFLDAQLKVDRVTAFTAYELAVLELSQGRKKSHWMWFVFPQLPLGKTPTSLDYAIRNLDEARRYLAHPVLGDRLRSCFDTLLKHSDKSAAQIFGSALDAKKLRSSATLFQQACAGSGDPRDACFQQVLDKYYAGKADQATIDLLQAQQQRPA